MLFGKSSTVKDMQIAVVNWALAHLPKDSNKAHFGLVRGNSVIINNKSYPYAPAVDLFFQDGDRVACIMPDSGNIVAVVGVL